jgi:hypothetical protein
MLVRRLEPPATEINPHPEGLKMLRVEAPEYDATFEVYGDCPVKALRGVLLPNVRSRARSKFPGVRITKRT